MHVTTCIFFDTLTFLPFSSRLKSPQLAWIRVLILEQLTALVLRSFPLLQRSLNTPDSTTDVDDRNNHEPDPRQRCESSPSLELPERERSAPGKSQTGWDSVCIIVARLISKISFFRSSGEPLR